MKFLPLLLACALAGPALADTTVGSVSTNFRLLGPNDKVVVQRFDDPKVPNVSCVATGPVTPPAGLPAKEEMGAIQASFLVKHFVLTRMVDPGHALVYVLISTKIIHGSPANAVSAVPITAP